jgi:hypothetical protein
MHSMSGYAGFGAPIEGQVETAQVGPYVYRRLTSAMAATVMGILAAYRIPTAPVASGPVGGGAQLVTAVAGPGEGTSLLGSINEMAGKGYAPTSTSAVLESLSTGSPVALAFFPDTALPELVALNAGAGSEQEQLLVIFDPPHGWSLQEKKPVWQMAGIGVVGWSAIGAAALGALYLAKRRRRRAA